MREVVVIGVGMHPWGKFPGKTYLDIGRTAMSRALDNAGLQWNEIQAMTAGCYVWGGTNGYAAGNELAQSFGYTGIPITNVFNGCATASSSFRSAYQIVASGEQDICLAIGMEVSPEGFFPFMGEEGDKTSSDFLRWRMVGVSNPGYWALEARKRMEEVGTTEMHYALAKVAASKHGALNPDACFKKVYTVEEVLNSPMVCDPLRLFEICATRDGAACAILCSKEKARQYTDKPVTVAGVGVGSCMYGDPTVTVGKLAAMNQGTGPVLSESYASAQMAYKHAGLGPEDVDFVELPDNSSWHYLAYLDCLGFTKPGEAEKMLEAGDTLIGGKLPVCPSGGASSHGQAVAAQGLLQVVECVTQLRGQAGARQVEGARVGMAHTEGFLGNAGTAILKI